MKFGISAHKFLLGAAIVAAGIPLGAEALSYTVTDLGELFEGGFNPIPRDINNSGQVVGSEFHVDDGITNHAFLYDGTTIRDIGNLGEPESAGYGVNDAGQVSGYSEAADGRHVFLYDGTTMLDLGIGNGRALNNAGQVTGERRSTSGQSNAFFYDGTSMVDLGTLGGESSIGNDINDAGQIAGRIYFEPGKERAFLYDGDIMRDLGTLGGASSVGDGINGMGHVTGRSDTSIGESHAFLYDGFDMVDLGTLGGSTSSGLDINDTGQIVGLSSTSIDAYTHAFLYDSTLGGMVDLNDFIDPLSGWVLHYATAINNQGQIAGFGTMNGETRAFLLTPDAPIPEPATLSLLGMGLVGLAARARRRSTRA